ncbi:DNA-binding response OmpR family regulator [Aneurinibacillus soli]|uniref:Response regulator protein GraR n=1 Tax=Aneurinibacillus soli TaxID=1500254 RepID=A0A0U5C8S4_9BACL|nr:response regulator transcription factor [Aneurinibacillus soli]PYE62057.1 DNA-binding response OmpR family regulator [Aneurinibacillus soli]BAU28755.1 Response regulator protein GraR [Aneurinibacillus soli]
MFTVMLVEDDPKLREIIEENIRKWGFDVHAVQQFDHVFADFIEQKPHLVLLDINLPSFNGFYWCQKIREVSNVPIIFISSRNESMDIVMAINMGGDDFIQKPFSLDVLIAKIQAILRRTYSYADTDTNVLQYKQAMLDSKAGTLTHAEQKIELTKNEFNILHLLMKNAGTIVNRDKIMRSLWEDESFVDDNTLTVNINRLRKKLADIQLHDFIQTKKGQGYMIP